MGAGLRNFGWETKDYLFIFLKEENMFNLLITLDGGRTKKSQICNSDCLLFR
jgi:hypothetical protein